MSNVRRLAIGDWRLAIGDWRLAIGDWRLAIGDYPAALAPSFLSFRNLQKPSASLIIKEL
jgi:hypothetical protein